MEVGTGRLRWKAGIESSFLRFFYFADRRIPVFTGDGVCARVAGVSGRPEKFGSLHFFERGGKRMPLRSSEIQPPKTLPVGPAFPLV